MIVPEVWSVRHGVAPLLDMRAWGGGLGVLGIAALLGVALLPRLRSRSWGDAVLLRLLAGLVAAPLALLGIGQVQGAIFAVPWGTLALAGGIALAGFTIFEPRRRPAAPEATAPAEPPPSPLIHYLTLAGWGLLALSLAGRLLPAFCPPVGYDTLEYHMGIIPNIFQAGRVRPIPGIFYSAQPLATEMLYTLAALIEGTPWGFGPGVIHWALIVLVSLTAARVLARVGVRPAWRPWLLLLALEHSLLLRLQIERMSDWFGVLMLAGGVWIYLNRQQPEFTGQVDRELETAGLGQGALKTAALMGLFVGGAVESKWTHAGTVAAPLLVLALGLGWDAPGASTGLRLRRALFTAALCGGVGLLVWLPWGAWLYALKGNPFAPFLAGLFPSAEWPPERLHFLLTVHEPLNPAQGAYWLNLAQKLAGGVPGPPLIALALGAAAALALARGVAKRGQPGTSGVLTVTQCVFIYRLAIGMVISLLLWGNLRQAADRFMGPTTLGATFILAVALEGMIRAVQARRPGYPALLTLLLATLGGLGVAQNLLFLRPLAAHACGQISREAYLSAIFGEGEVGVIRAANGLPAGSRILALNDARRYLYTGRIDTASVFDRSPIRPAVSGAADGETIRRRLLERGVTHVLFNGFEQVRILRMQTPLSLTHDPAFRNILNRPNKIAADEMLARRYVGITEFSVDPLTPAERKAYEDFLALLRPRAIASLPPDPTAAPAFWLAPLK